MTERIEALERLARLRAEGVLTDNEFATQKQILLGQGLRDNAEPAPGTFAYGWKQSSGFRRLLRWFWGIQAAVLAVLAIFFFARLAIERPAVPRLTNRAESNATEEPAIDNAATAAMPAASAEAVEQTGIPTDIELTDQNLANPWTYDGDSDEMLTSSEACLNGDVTIINHTSQPLKLQLSELETAADVRDLRTLSRGMSAMFKATTLGKFVLTKEDRSSLYLISVQDCSSGE